MIDAFDKLWKKFSNAPSGVEIHDVASETVIPPFCISRFHQKELCRTAAAACVAEIEAHRRDCVFQNVHDPDKANMHCAPKPATIAGDGPLLLHVCTSNSAKEAMITMSSIILLGTPDSKYDPRCISWLSANGKSVTLLHHDATDSEAKAVIEVCRNLLPRISAGGDGVSPDTSKDSPGLGLPGHGCNSLADLQKHIKHVGAEAVAKGDFVVKHWFDGNIDAASTKSGICVPAVSRRHFATDKSNTIACSRALHAVYAARRAKNQQEPASDRRSQTKIIKSLKREIGMDVTVDISDETRNWLTRFAKVAKLDDAEGLWSTIRSEGTFDEESETITADYIERVSIVQMSWAVEPI